MGTLECTAGLWGRICLAAFFAIVLSFAGATASAQDNEEQQRTRILSDRVIYTQQDNRILFQDNVHVEREDFLLWSEEMTVFLVEEDGEGDAQQEAGREMQDFERIVARDNVRIQMEQRNATSREAVYTSADSLLVLTGDVRLQQGRNVVHGHEVHINLDQGTSEVMSGEQEQVEATFYSGDNGVESNGDSEGD